MNVHFGIIGPGYIASRFAAVLADTDDVTLTAVASASSKTKAADFAAKYGAGKAYSSYEELVNDDQVDVVYIGLTHNYHYEAIKLCINHGKGVICEKPMTISRKEAEEVTALAREKNILLMEAMWTRFLPAFIRAKQWTREGKIGAVKLIQASFCFNFPFDPEHRLFNPKLAGSSLLDAGVYPIEFASGIIGENPVDITGVLHNCATGVDDFAAISLKFPSGALANLSCGLTAKTSLDAYIYGSEGHIVVYDFLKTRSCESYNRDGLLVDSFTSEPIEGFTYQILHFADLYRKGLVESDLMPHQDSIACAAVFDTLLGKQAQ